MTAETPASRVAGATAIAVLLLVCSGGEIAASGDDVRDRLIRATLLIRAERDQPGRGEGRFRVGSGWIVDHEEGLVVTTHELSSFGRIQIGFPRKMGGRWIKRRESVAWEDASIRVLKFDTQRDLALLRVPGLPEHCAALALGDPTTVDEDRVHAVHHGNHPQDRLWQYTRGTRERSAFTSVGVRESLESRAYRASMVVNSSLVEDSGGSPVSDGEGDLVGMAVAGVGQTAVVIDVAEIRDFLEKEKAGATFPRRSLTGPWIGRLNRGGEFGGFVGIEFREEERFHFEMVVSHRGGRYRFDGDNVLFFADDGPPEIAAVHWTDAGLLRLDFGNGEIECRRPEGR